VHTLDTIFNELARLSRENLRAQHLEATDRLMRLALKAQSQCRATIETLAEIKNPSQVAFVKQANIAHGPQQVNNGRPGTFVDEHARAGKNPSTPNGLLEKIKHVTRVGGGTSREIAPIHTSLDSVDALYGPKDC
jgi:hypothetical protein